MLYALEHGFLQELIHRTEMLHVYRLGNFFVFRRGNGYLVISDSLGFVVGKKVHGI